MKAGIRFLLMCFTIILLGACERIDTKHKKTIEENLVETFQNTDENLQAQIDRIVKASKEKDFQFALNNLALISAHNQLTKDQKKAIESLMRQLRYDMEEVEFGEQTE